MQYIFEADPQKDPKLLDIKFTEENNDLCMEIFYNDEESSKLLEGRLRTS